MNSDRIPSAREIVYSGICGGDSNTQEFFHCTPVKNLQSILRTGLIPGDGKTFDTEGHSTGRIFVAIGYDEAVLWQEMIAKVTKKKTAILLLHLTKKQIQSLRTDKLAYIDGNICSAFLTTPVRASQIVVRDDGEGTLNHVQMFEGATKNDIYGKYLFGQERGLPDPKNRETNTAEENELYSAMHDQYHGEMWSLNSYIAKLADLEAKNKYTDVLRVPKKYKYAYRVMDVPYKTLTNILGKTPEHVTPGRMVHAKRGIFRANEGDERKHYSWTVDPVAFKEMLDDWGYLHQKPGYLVFLRAPIGGNGNRFLLNPDSEVLKKLSDEYAYQREVISVGDIQCDNVWYVDTTKHQERGFTATARTPSSLDFRAARQMVGHDKELRSLKETLDYLVDKDDKK